MIGQVFSSKSGQFVVTSRTSRGKVLVKFLEDGYEKEVFTAAVYKGAVKNPYKPSVYGVGFMGDGPHKAKIDGQTSRSYEIWSGVMGRCYDEKVHLKYPNYAGCSVDRQWHNFQEFAEWCQWQVGFKEGWTLDKDLVRPLNKVYSPETCVFLPNEINASLNFKRSGNYCGVSFHKATGKFVAQLCGSGKNYHLGLFENEYSAYMAYKSAKEDQIKQLAIKFKESLDEVAFNALMRWEVRDRE